MTLERQKVTAIQLFGGKILYFVDMQPAVHGRRTICINLTCIVCDQLFYFLCASTYAPKLNERLVVHRRTVSGQMLAGLCNACCHSMKEIQPLRKRHKPE
jgi:hypothetical protein